MKHIYAFILSMFALCGLSRAQFIAENRVTAAGAETENSNEPQVCPLGPAPAAPWKKEADQVFGHIGRSLLAKLKGSSEGIISVFHDSILTQGTFDPIWHGEYFSAGNGAPQMRFGVSCIFHNDDVNPNDPCDLTIFANDISPLTGSLTVNGQAFVTLKGFTGSSPAFEFDMPAHGGNSAADTETVHVKAWLVAADSSMLPYIPVTRKEYLSLAQQELENRKEMLIADIKSRINIRSATQQETGKQQALDQLRKTYSGADLQTRTRIFLSSYKTDEEYMKQHITAATEELDRTLALIGKLLTGSTPQQLAQPAVVSVAAVEFRGFEDGRPGSTVLVRLRGDYYNADADQLTIKSLLICWRYHPADRMAAGIDQQLALRSPVPRLRKQFAAASK
ncbi:MAG TPA: hypothetical protein VGQ51_13155 [Puia sp.]|jgi:hypothetical protein|nr:hypothetical protein [Puia sp.]